MIPHIPHRTPYNSGDPRFDDTDLYDDKVIVLSTLGQGPSGEKGDSFEFDDFTQEQLDYLRSGVASVYNYQKKEATYHTVGTNTSTIQIPIDGYTANDMLFVDIEGLSLAEGTDYTISNGSIVLTHPITHDSTSVNFKALQAVAVTEGD